MKKKLKLFLSISSLCFALAMLCFGVYSAQTVNYSLNGNVTYTVQDAFVEVQTKLYKSTTNLTHSQLGQKVNDVAGMDFATTPEGLTLVDTSEVYSSISGVPGTYEKPNLSFSTQAGSECYAYFFVINIKNLSSDVNVWAKMEDDFTNPTNTVQINNKSQPTIDQTGENMVIGLTVEDFTQNIPTTNNAFRYDIKIGVGDLPIEQLNSGNVTYTIEEALVEVQTKLYKSTTFLTSSQLGLKVNDVAEMDFASAPEGLILVDTSEVYSSTSDVPGIYENVNLSFSTQMGSECYAYFFVVNIKNLSTDVNVWAVMEDELTNPANTVQINNGLQQNISQTGNNMVIGIGIEDLTQNISTENNTFSYGIKIGVGDLATQDFNLAKLTFSNGTVAANRSNMNGVVVIPDKNPTTGEAITTIKGTSWPYNASTEGFANTNFTTIAMEDNIQTIENYVAFTNNKLLTSVIFPQNLTSIGSNAFAGCSKLATIAIPSGVTSIENSAFHSCTGLAKVTIPNGVTSIGDLSFYGCTDLTSITIPSSIKYIGGGAFYGCTELEYTDSANGLKYIKTVDNNYFVLCGTVNTTQQTYIINENCKIILYNAFRDCTRLTEITIPDGVTCLGQSVFSGCTVLNRVTIPNSVTYIGGGAFDGCTDLTSIVIPGSVTSIGASAFSGCTGLTRVTIPSNVESVNGNIFFGCTGLNEVIIENGVTSIESNAFEGCTNLTSITIPNSVANIGSDAFKGCIGLQIEDTANSLKYIKTTDNNYFALYGTVDTNLTSYTINKDCRFILNGAFSSCIELDSITIPDKVISIEYRAFDGCTGLTSIVIPSSVKNIGQEALRNCSSLNSITIPSSVTSIGTWAFKGCTRLNEVVIENGVTKIEYGAFEGCTSLTSIEIPSSVASIGQYAFLDCTGLISITIPSSVISMGYDAFSNWTASQTIKVPFAEGNTPSGWRSDWNYNCNAKIEYLAA